MDRRRGQPLGLGRDDRVDRPALQPDLAAQSVALLLVEIDVVVGIVEEALVLLDEIAADADRQAIGERDIDRRSEEHTSELQSLMRISYAVFCLKKKKKKKETKIMTKQLTN